MSKRVDPIYHSPQWPRVRKYVLRRDGYRCVICGADVSASGAARVDHIRRVTDGGAPFDPDNLRTLCVTHDQQSHREKGTGSKIREERFGGCDVTGMPLDPRHRWNL
jgi:5-methylcytosine-specific restriction endonuclease McrA